MRVNKSESILSGAPRFLRDAVEGCDVYKTRILRLRIEQKVKEFDPPLRMLESLIPIQSHP